MVYILFQTIFKRIFLEQLAIFHEEQEDMRLQDPLKDLRVILPNKQVAETHHAEETKAIADATQSLGASKSAKDQVNQLKIADAEKTPDSANNASQESTAKTLNAFADMPAQSDPFGHLHEELRTLNTKVDQLESSISKKVTDTLTINLLGLLSEALKDSLPQMLKDSIKQSVSESIVEKLP
nr:hypothetical protein [Tanacetum cinerariifolium]